MAGAMLSAWKPLTAFSAVQPLVRGPQLRLCVTPRLILIDSIGAAI
jgi:hypothetical protein